MNNHQKKGETKMPTGNEFVDDLKQQIKDEYPILEQLIKQRDEYSIKQRLDLTFSRLRQKNVVRCDVFQPLFDWSPVDYSNAIAGEAGEACIITRKMRRLLVDGLKEECTIEEFKAKLMKELADIVIYVDLLAARIEGDLAGAIIVKFNEASDKMGSSIKL